VAPSVESVDNLWLGILLDPQQATVVHDLGPYGGSAEVDIHIIINIISAISSITIVFIMISIYYQSCHHSQFSSFCRN